ncbi:MAG: PIN domain-containing protein [Anaerolineales bacterium]|nr:PIN domain-containing protein [Chloroflexota bacterium]MBL6980684.1 PIN domain-containing protein [Anaerolineales bacterium]
MNGYLVDSNVVLDLFLNDPNGADWSQATLATYGDKDILYINQVVYTEVSIGFERIEELEKAMQIAAFQMLEIPKEALFLAGKAFLNYRRNRGIKSSPLSDFYISAQAAVMDLYLITRDESRYRTYFPTVNLITPQL